MCTLWHEVYEKCACGNRLRCLSRGTSTGRIAHRQPCFPLQLASHSVHVQGNNEQAQGKTCLPPPSAFRAVLVGGAALREENVAAATAFATLEYPDEAPTQLPARVRYELLVGDSQTQHVIYDMVKPQQVQDPRSVLASISLRGYQDAGRLAHALTTPAAWSEYEGTQWPATSPAVLCTQWGAGAGYRLDQLVEAIPGTSPPLCAQHRRTRCRPLRAFVLAPCCRRGECVREAAGVLVPSQRNRRQNAARILHLLWLHHVVDHMLRLRVTNEQFVTHARWQLCRGFVRVLESCKRSGGGDVLLPQRRPTDEHRSERGRRGQACLPLRLFVVALHVHAMGCQLQWETRLSVSNATSTSASREAAQAVTTRTLFVHFVPECAHTEVKQNVSHQCKHAQILLCVAKKKLANCKASETGGGTAGQPA